MAFLAVFKNDESKIWILIINISNILCTIHSINKERKILQTIFVDHIYMYNFKGFETLLKDILKTCNIYIVTGIKWMKIWNWNFVSLEAKNLFDKGSSPLIGYITYSFQGAPTNFKQSLLLIFFPNQKRINWLQLQLNFDISTTNISNTTDMLKWFVSCFKHFTLDILNYNLDISDYLFL